MGVILSLGVFGFWMISSRSKSSLVTPITNKLSETKEAKKIVPSETFLEYQDLSGFTFSYPDNLSIVKNEIEDESVYADIELTSKDVNGSLSLKISDSKFKTLDEWLDLNKGDAIPAEINLGSLKGKEIKLKDRVLLGALDQGVFFNIEVPKVEEEFWMKVYEKLLSGFSFAIPENASAQTTASEEVIFEGEEVVE